MKQRHIILILLVIGFIPAVSSGQVAVTTEPLYFRLSGTKTPGNLVHYLNDSSWNQLFPRRYGLNPSDTLHHLTDFYSFKAFVTAAGIFPGFLSEGNEETQKRELSAFLANIAYETGGGWANAPGGYFTWGLYFTEEKSGTGERFNYVDTTKKNYPPFEGSSYYGRGPVQLSWNYNYGKFSEAWFGNKDSLLENPGLISKDPVLSFASALWFWMTAQFPKPSCHDIMTGNWTPDATDSAKGRIPGFGAVVNVINGGVSCGDGPANEKAVFRYRYYQFFCDYFHVTAGENISCNTQKPFGQ